MVGLNFDDVAKYLRSGGLRDRWTPVVGQAGAENISRTQTLREVLATPLMAMLAKSVYSRAERDPSELLDFSTASELSDHLLDHFVVTRFDLSNPPLKSTEKPYTDWGAGSARTWLGFLAATLVSQEDDDFAWWKIRTAEIGMPLRRATLSKAVNFLTACESLRLQVRRRRSPR